MKKYFLPLGVLGIFMTIAVTLWLTQDNIFYLFNFSYIGISIFFGIFLYIKKYKYARRVAQLLVGLYMLVYLGFICGENMQIEGFWYYLFTGVFEAATIHYAVAKIFGPLLFGRGWCGYACWTAMVLDFLPYKVPKTPRKKIGWIRYITFAISLIFVSVLFLAHIGNIERIMFWAFIIGNAIYYIVGIILAFVFKDNRAFCKYISTFSEKPVSDLLHSLSVISKGISTVNVVPSCFLLCTEMVPPIISTYFFTIAIPSPTPWYCVLTSESSCANSSKISFVNSSLMPIPVSEMR